MDKNTQNPTLGGTAKLSAKRLLRRARAVDWPTPLLVASVVLSLAFLRSYSLANRGLASEVTRLQEDLETSLPREGDSLTIPSDVTSVAGTRLPLLAGAQAAVWVFFSVPCRDCIAELPSWGQLKTMLAREDTPARFISLDTPLEVRASVTDSRVEIGIAPPGMTRTLHLTVVPCYMLVGPGGKVEWVHRGRLSDSDRTRLQSRVSRPGGADPRAVGVDHVSPSRPD
jgi:hypothetical protein